MFLQEILDSPLQSSDSPVINKTLEEYKKIGQKKEENQTLASSLQ